MNQLHLDRAVPHLDSDPPAVADSDALRDGPFRVWVRTAAIGDLVAAGLAAAVAQRLRLGAGNEVFVAGSSLRPSYMTIGILVALGWPALLAVCGGYDLRTLLVGVEELRRVVRSAISLLALLGFVFFTTRVYLSRGYVASLVPYVALFTGAWRYLLRRRIARQQQRGVGHHNVVAVGKVDDLQWLCMQLLARPGSAIDLVAVVVDDLDADSELTGALAQVLRLPDRNAIQRLADQGTPVDLLVRAGRPRPEEVWTLARRAHDLGAGLAIAPHREDASAHVAVSYVPLGNTPLLVVETPTLHPVARVTKAVFDRTLAVLMLLALAPVLLGVAVAVLIVDGFPILYSQERVGRDGRSFRCLKFRTMRRDADALLDELREFNDADGPLFKMRNDPRVTRIGAFLRSHSFDELPQLFNVLAGSMSIVGPRPPLPNEAATYNEREARRLLVKPGLTGLWQVEGRSDLPWDDGVYLDLLYVEHWSPLLDLAIIARTVRAVLRPAGAY